MVEVPPLWGSIPFPSDLRSNGYRHVYEMIVSTYTHMYLHGYFSIVLDPLVGKGDEELNRSNTNIRIRRMLSMRLVHNLSLYPIGALSLKFISMHSV